LLNDWWRQAAVPAAPACTVGDAAKTAALNGLIAADRSILPVTLRRHALHHAHLPALISWELL